MVKSNPCGETSSKDKKLVVRLAAKTNPCGEACGEDKKLVARLVEKAKS